MKLSKNTVKGSNGKIDDVACHETFSRDLILSKSDQGTSRVSERLRKEEEMLRISYQEETKSAQFTDRPDTTTQASGKSTPGLTVTPRKQASMKPQPAVARRSRRDVSPLSKSLDSSQALKGLRNTSAKAKPRNAAPLTNRQKSTTPKRSLSTSKDPLKDMKNKKTAKDEKAIVRSSNIKPKFKRQAPMTERTAIRDVSENPRRSSKQNRPLIKTSTESECLNKDLERVPLALKENSVSRDDSVLSSQTSLASSMKISGQDQQQLKQLQGKASELHRKYEDIMTEKRKLMKLLSRV